MTTMGLMDEADRLALRDGLSWSATDAAILAALLAVGGEDDPTGVSRAAIETYLSWRDEGLHPVSAAGEVACGLGDSYHYCDDVQSVVDAIAGLGVFEVRIGDAFEVDSTHGPVTVPSPEIAAWLVSEGFGTCDFIPTEEVTR